MASLLLAALCLIPLALAQNPVATDDMMHGIGSLEDVTRTASRYETAPNTAVLIVEVFNEKSGTHLDRQAMIKLVNLATQTAIWQPTEESSQGAFTNLTYGNYEVEASAVGYLSFHQEVQIIPTNVQRTVNVVLHRDPSAVNLDVENSIASPKARKETKRAIQALKSGRLDYAQHRLDEAYKSSPGDSNVNFLLGYVYFQRKDFERSANYLTTSIDANPRNTQALTLLGRAGLERRDYPAARSALERAILGDDQNWMPHNLLANAYLHEKDYPKARDEAKAAIAKGKDAASPAQLVLGEALLNLGNSKDGIQALQTFLQQSPQQPLAGQVRTLIANVEDRELADSSAASTQGTPRITGVDPLLALPAPKLSTKAWQPPGVDDVKVSVAPDIACPTQTVIDESGKRIEELVQDVARFAAVEDLYHQALDEYGNPVRTETRKYNYVASISEPEPGFLAVDEYRADKLSLDGYPDRIASTGFAGLALVFHPHVRGNFDMACEGLGEWHGRATWMVHFRQRDDRPNRMHGYMVGNQIHAVKMKGRAWITSDKFQIVRIEAEMVSPMPEIQLLSEHQVVEYGPIPFPKKNLSLWLPKSAEIYFDFRKHRYYRRHSFDHYMLYSVDTEDKVKGPVAKKDPS